MSEPVTKDRLSEIGSYPLLVKKITWYCCHSEPEVKNLAFFPPFAKGEYKGDFALHNHSSFFHPGQNIVLREIWQEKIWSARPVIVVQDKPELLALYMPPGTAYRQPKTPDGKRVAAANRLYSKWILKEERIEYCCLRLIIPSASYSVLLFWDMPDLKLHSFYINMENPLCRTPVGFYHLDQWLDIIVKPDLSDWNWKDEDELAEAVELGLISKERAAAMYAEGERAAKWIQSGKSPFNGWENWRPDPAWKIPVLPEGWDIL